MEISLGRLLELRVSARVNVDAGFPLPPIAKDPASWKHVDVPFSYESSPGCVAEELSRKRRTPVQDDNPRIGVDDGVQGLANVRRIAMGGQFFVHREVNAPLGGKRQKRGHGAKLHAAFLRDGGHARPPEVLA